MQDGFSEVKLFQVHPDKTGEFEALIRQVAAEQLLQAGCRDIRCIKRFFTIDGVEAGSRPENWPGSSHASSTTRTGNLTAKRTTGKRSPGFSSATANRS